MAIAGPSAESVAPTVAAAAGALRLVVSCPDRPGIVAAVSSLLRDRGANILYSNQFASEPTGAGRFFLRMEFTIPPAGRAAFARDFGAGVAQEFDMTWRISDPATPKRIAVLVSRYDHCLHDLLWRWRRGELGGEIVQVISNWEDLRRDVEAAGLPYHHVPVPPGGKPQAERAMLGLLDGTCDLVVLARYMQILSSDFLEGLALPVINIHHSFLPAFEGANPYARAKERGVKLVGATAHYATPDLDAGPIIEQGVVRVTHAQSVEDLTRMGAEVERAVLARAVRWHCEDRVILNGSSTVVF